ncbi:MAG TPA: hypothetical protein VGN00_03475 [Puia sp.]|jgi:hypothetical protein
MRRKVVYTIAVVICLLPALVLPAQKRHSPAVPAPVLKVTVDKQKILIGEPIHLMLEATVQGDVPLIWPDLDSLPHFEFVEKGKVDSTGGSDGRSYRQYMTVTSFDSGSYAIPRLAFTEGNKKYFTDSIGVEIGYTKIDPSKDYHDIKEIIEVPNPYAHFIVWGVAAVALISLAVVIWLIRKKKVLKRLAAAVQAPRLSPYEEALAELKDLEQAHLPEKGSVKVYYSRLGEIFRIYLLRRLKISGLAETSEELIREMRQLQLPAEQFPALAETLRMSDFVKFAKYQPEATDNEQHYRVIRSSVETLEAMAVSAEAAATAQTQQEKSIK